MISRNWRANGMAGRAVERAAIQGGALAARLRLPVLLLAGLVIAHDAIFASDAGFAALAGALARSGHGESWALITVLGLAGAWLVAVGALAHIVRLRREVRLLERGRGDRSTRVEPRRSGAQAGAYWAEVRRLWPRLLIFVAVGFLLQENAEAILDGSRAVGLEPLLGAHPLAIPLLLALTLAMSAVAALVRRGTRALEDRVKELRARVGRHIETRPARPAAGALPARDSIRLRPQAGRAPPLQVGTVSA